MFKIMSCITAVIMFINVNALYLRYTNSKQLFSFCKVRIIIKFIQSIC